MLEVQLARSGEPTLTFNSKFLASKVDPRKEAEKWADNAAEAFMGLRSAIVIGAGAGYHLIELKRRCPHLSIVCLESAKEIVDHHKKNFELARFGIRILHLDLAKLFELEDIRSALRGSYKVVLHPSSAISHGESLITLLDRLNGRTTEGLEAILQIREWQHPPFIAKDEIVSIKNIDADEIAGREPDESGSSYLSYYPLLMELLK